MLHTLATTCWARSVPHWVTRRFKSSYILRTPPKSAPRECPTPLVFVSAKAWDADSDKGMTTLSSMLAEQGFTCLQTDLALPDTQKRSDSVSLMKSFEDDLRSAVRLSMIPFPPVIFSRSASCLITQTYISSNPATGLVLLSPPTNNAELEQICAQDGLPLLPTRLPEFDFEPHFPIAVLASSLQHMAILETSNRLAQAPGVDRVSIDDLKGQQVFDYIQSWLDRLGI